MLIYLLLNGIVLRFSYDWVIEGFAKLVQLGDAELEVSLELPRKFISLLLSS